jgi:integrase
MMLQALLESAISKGFVVCSRVGPLKTAVRQYAAMFGVDATDLPPEKYQLSKQALFAWIETHTVDDIGPRTLANLKNNLRWLLDLGVKEKWLLPLSGPVIPWKSQKHLPQHRLTRGLPSDGINIDRSGYRLLLPLDPSKVYSPGMDAYIQRQRVGLQLMPDALREEMEKYLRWCASDYAPNRPAKIKKRSVSACLTRDAIRSIGGYAVHIAGMPATDLSLHTLTDPLLVQAFVEWWVNQRRQRVTRTITDMLMHLYTIAEYWLKTPEHAKGILDTMHAFGKAIPDVWDKEASLMSLRELERVGLSCYPFNDERLHYSRFARDVLKYSKDPVNCPLPKSWNRNGSLYKTTGRVQMSLMIRLLVRIPLRQRNLREMKLDHNLKRTSDGWEVHFRGTELKISARRGMVNEVRQPIPRDLQPLVEEWLTVWRPRRLPPGSDSPLVFLNRYGKPLTSDVLTQAFTRTIYRFTGRYTTPHMVRDSWASEYLDATGDIAGAADKLGDSPATVMKHYAHILKRKAQDRTDLWLGNHLA